MKITAISVATGPNGEDLGFPEPVSMIWAKDTDEIGVMLSVAQLLEHARNKKFTKTLAIHIDL